jgi:lycopene beta-cyclase
VFLHLKLIKINYGNTLKVLKLKLKKMIFDDQIFNLMDFDCDQRDSVHFFYTLPYSKNKALVETTWLSK